jgi:predicted RNA binding protein YcfA (HicA-like mRNA interferase family)
MSKNKQLTTVLDYKKAFRKTNDFIRYIENLGYIAKNTDRRGGHIIYTKPGYTPLSVPDHKEMSVGVCGSLAKIILSENK